MSKTPPQHSNTESPAETYRAIVALEKRLQAMDGDAFQRLLAAEEREQKSGAAAPVSDTVKRHRAQIRELLNGFAPPFVSSGAVSSAADIRIELAEIREAQRVINRRREDAAEKVAEAWAAEHAVEWSALLRDIVLTATRLHALEQKAGATLEAAEKLCQASPPVKMFRHVSSILGIGDPLREVVADALSEKIVTEAELRGAKNV